MVMFVLMLNTCLAGVCEYHVGRYFPTMPACESEIRQYVKVYREANKERTVRKAFCGTRTEMIYILGLEI